MRRPDPRHKVAPAFSRCWSDQPLPAARSQASCGRSLRVLWQLWKACFIRVAAKVGEHQASFDTHSEVPQTPRGQSATQSWATSCLRHAQSALSAYELSGTCCTSGGCQTCLCWASVCCWRLFVHVSLSRGNTVYNWARAAFLSEARLQPQELEEL